MLYCSRDFFRDMPEGGSKRNFRRPRAFLAFVHPGTTRSVERAPSECQRTTPERQQRASICSRHLRGVAGYV